MTEIHIETVPFPNQNQARLLVVSHDATVDQMLAALELAPPRAMLVLNGGTAEMEPDLADRLTRLLRDGVARVVAEEEIVVVTGGTDAGIFHQFGRGRAAWGRTAPCIGVAVADLVTWPGKGRDDAPLEPNHSHFVLVEGRDWGDETGTMYALVDALARDCPSLAVFAGGGEITVHEMQANVRQERNMILIAGSGRATDAVLAAQSGDQVEDTRLHTVAQQGTVTPFDVNHDPARLRALIRRILIKS